MKTIAKYSAFIAALIASLYICIAGGEMTAIVALLVMIAIVGVAAGLIGAALLLEIYRALLKPVYAAIRRAF